MKNLLIIGGAQGIGQAFARQLSLTAYNLFLTSRSYPNMEKKSAGLFTLPCELTQPESIDKVFNFIQHRLITWI